MEVELRDQYLASLRGSRLAVYSSNLGPRPAWLYTVGTSCRYVPVELPGTIAMRKQFADVVAGPAADGIISASVKNG